MKHAIASALRQTALREEYEIILVMDFRDASIEKLASAMGVIVLHRSGAVGAMIAAGLDACFGEVVLFLDDDDLFLPDKIKVTLSRFDSDSALTYYHNAFQQVNVEGVPLNRQGPCPSTALAFSGEGARETDILSALRVDGAHNLSSISVRRKWLLGYRCFLEGVEGSTDRCAFFLSLASGGRILIDPITLNQYRVHSRSSIHIGESNRAGLTRLLRENRRVLKTYKDLQNIMPGSPAAHVLAQLASARKVKLHALLGPRQEPVTPDEFVSALSLSIRYRNSEFWLSAALAIVSVISKRVSLAVYLALVRLRLNN